MQLASGRVGASARTTKKNYVPKVKLRKYATSTEASWKIKLTVHINKS